MLPIRTILHPTDFSEPSDHAFQVACAVARDYGARLLVLHVAPVTVAVEGVVAPPDDYREEMRQKLLRLPEQDPLVRMEPQVVEGDPAAEILRAAREAHADLIVMGTQGRTGLGRLLMGSVAEQVLRKGSCPVLTVRASLQRAQPPQISEEFVSEPAGEMLAATKP